MFKNLLRSSLLLLLLFGAFSSVDSAGQEIHFTEAFQVPPMSQSFTHTIHTKGPFNAFTIESPHLENLRVSVRPESGDAIFIEGHRDIESKFSKLYILDTQQSLSMRIDNPIPKYQNVLVHFYNTNDSSLETNPLLAGSINLGGLKVISRSQWGADENIRYLTEEQLLAIEEAKKENPDTEDEKNSTFGCNGLVDQYPAEFRYDRVVEKDETGRTMRWPLQYSKIISKVVVHHTAESDKSSEQSAKARMRAIYAYHTLTRGWGDIGYNYVIGPNGEIFEGRAGGAKVVGAHAFCNNIGTAGIALMGNFETNYPNEKQLLATVALVSELTKKYKINPAKSDKYHGARKPNILGHKDVRATACPGGNLYKLLPFIRKEASRLYNKANGINNFQSDDFSAELISSLESVRVDPNGAKEVTYTFKNTGSETWDENTWLYVYGGEQEFMTVLSQSENQDYVAADLIEKQVPPGETGRFKVRFVAQGGSPRGEVLNSFEFTPVINGKYKAVQSSIVQIGVVDQAILSFSLIDSKLPKTPLLYGEETKAWMKLKNTGNIPWTNDGTLKIQMRTSNKRDRNSLFSPDGSTKLGYLEESIVRPGEVGTFHFNFKAPAKAGRFREYVEPVIDSIDWLGGQPLSFVMDVKEPTHRFDLALSADSLTLFPGEKRNLTLRLTNTGESAWEPDMARVKVVTNNKAKVYVEGQETSLSTIYLNRRVPPNQSTELNLELHVPGTARGVTSVSFLPEYKGSAQKIHGRADMRLAIKNPKMKATPLLAMSDRTISVTAGRPHTIQLAFQNGGNTSWYRDGVFPVYLEPQLLSELQGIEIQAPIKMQEQIVKPSKTGTFDVTIRTKQAGLYRIELSVALQGMGKIRTSPVSLLIRSLPGNGEVVNENSAIRFSPITHYDLVFPLERSEWGKMKFPKLAFGSTGKQVEVKSPKVETEAPKEVIVTPPTPEPVSTGIGKSIQDTIRVKLSFNETEAIIGGNGDVQVTNLDGKELLILKRGDALKISEIDAHLQSFAGDAEPGFRFIPLDRETILEIQNWSHRPAWNPSLNDNRYRGVLETRIEDEKLIVINELPLADYMRGVAEVPNGEPLEKMKTLAVLARSYALFYTKKENRKFPDKPYDGSDDPDVFQKYLGYGYEERSPNFMEALEMTHGEVVTYNGNLIKPPYFNQSDGRTRSADEVWGWKDTPYLQSVHDPCCIGAELKGHGVGLSGVGATKMANEGKNYIDIIKYYYQGVEVDRLD